MVLCISVGIRRDVQQNLRESHIECEVPHHSFLRPLPNVDGRAGPELRMGWTTHCESDSELDPPVSPIDKAPVWRLVARRRGDIYQIQKRPRAAEPHKIPWTKRCNRFDPCSCFWSKLLYPSTSRWARCNSAWSSLTSWDNFSTADQVESDATKVRRIWVPNQTRWTVNSRIQRGTWDQKKSLRIGYEWIYQLKDSQLLQLKHSLLRVAWEMDLPAEGSTAAPAQTLTASCGMRPSKYCMGHTIHTSASDASCLFVGFVEIC